MARITLHESAVCSVPLLFACNLARFSRNMPRLFWVNVYIVINVYLIKKSTFLYMIYVCCYVSLRRPSDVGSTVTNCSCTLLTGHTESKSVYNIISLHAGVLC